jgi:hypothetical protein
MPSIVIQTAPTDRQTKMIMWADTIHHWNNRKVDLGGKAFTDPYLEIKKDNWYLLGFTTKETGSSAESGGGKFQGFHSPHICIIATEAQAIEDNIYDQIDAIATSGVSLVIFLGNPTRATGRFARGLRDKDRNIVFNFSCLDSPNYKELKDVIPGLVSYSWVEDKRIKWGEDDPRWVSRVLGQIPEMAVNNVFSAQVLNQAASRLGFLAMYSEKAGVAIDSAGEGVDDNVIMAGKGGEVLDTWTKAVESASSLAIKGVEKCREIKGNFIVVDCDGIGAMVKIELDKLPKAYTQGINILAFHGCSTDTKKIKIGVEEKKVYHNIRSEAAFIAKNRIMAGKASVDRKDKELVEDLEADEYFTNKQGFIQLIDKDDIRDDLGRSPGKGDCYKMLQWAFEQELPEADGAIVISHESMQTVSGYAIMR